MGGERFTVRLKRLSRVIAEDGAAPPYSPPGLGQRLPLFAGKLTRYRIRTLLEKISGSAQHVAPRRGRRSSPQRIGFLGCFDRLDCDGRVGLPNAGDNLGRVCRVDVARLLTPGAPFARYVGPKLSSRRRDPHRP